jgi:D-serine deaminase-like pyridoxal phosphate-dependent protein
VIVGALRTPAILIDRAKALRNLDRMQAEANANGIRLRPHSKTHKSPLIAQWQLDRGAIGICCAKLGEAEVFANSGIADIRLPYPLNPANADRVVALSNRTRLSFIVDHPAVVKQWSEALVRRAKQLDVLVKVDVGFHRCGIDPAASDAVAMIKAVAALPGLRLKGLLSHAGHAYHAHSEDEMKAMAEDEARTMRELADKCRAAGVTIDEISAGATPPARYSIKQKGFTEYRPGNYVYFDRTQVGLGAAALDRCALTVLATVVSKPAPARIILDSGSKALAADGARGFLPLAGYATVLRDVARSTGPDPDLIVERLSEEHATVRAVSGATSLEPGDRVRLIPNHSCVVSNLVDRAWLTEEGAIVGELPIAARGRSF